LDKDGDGQISVSEFAEGFNEIHSTLMNGPAPDAAPTPQSPHEAKVPRRSRERRRAYNDEEKAERANFESRVREVVGGLDESFAELSW
jgi:hypothetical protein